MGATSQPLRREERAAQTRATVLDAAIEIFAAQGCDGTTVRDIAERSGVKQPLILYHFESKEELWKASVDEVCSRMETTLFAWIVEHGLSIDEAGELVGIEPPETLRIVMRAFLQAVSEHPEYLRMLLREASHHGSRFDWLDAHHTHRNFALGTNLLRSLQQRGFFPDVPAEHLVYILAGALTFIFAVEADVRKQTGRDPRKASFLDAHVDALLKLLHPR